MPPAHKLSPYLGFGLLEVLKEAIGQTDVNEAYDALGLTLANALSDATKEANILLSSDFTRMEFLCRELNYTSTQRHRLNAARNRINHLGTSGETDKKETKEEDVLNVAKFIADLSGVPLPHELNKNLPSAPRPASQQVVRTEKARMVLSRWDDDYAYGQLDSGEPAKLRYNVSNAYGSWEYLRQLFHPHMQLSLARPVKAPDGTLTADLIVCLPDLLINITTVTSCINPVGNSHLWYLINLFEPSPLSGPILLGQFSGQLLDAQLHNNSNKPTDYKENVREFFQHNGLKILLLQESGALQNFHAQAKTQLCNIDSIITKQLPELRGYDFEKVVLEPTVLCDTLGLQGRMDLLQSDYKVLIEQKSGKCDEWRSSHMPSNPLHYQESHYAQFLLYQAMLRYGLRIPNDKISGALLYSKYPNGLILTGPAPRLLAECIALRNHIAILDYRLAQGELEPILASLNPEDFNKGKPEAPLWVKYIGPKVNSFFETLRGAPALARAYFYRFVAFICQERLLARVGAPLRQLDCFASIWCASQLEKQEAGSILDELSIEEIIPTEKGAGAEKIILKLPLERANATTNFRSGDIVVLHSYELNATPNATAGLLFRGSIEQMSSRQVTVRLRAPQRNTALFTNAPLTRWAIEHDHYEISEQRQLQSLFTILRAPIARRDLLLAQRAPRVDSARALLRDHTLPNGNKEFNTLALRAKQARDLFLVVGPPGTGKTSFGLMCILREEIATPNTNVLLLAFTNRAVDEICSKLEKDGVEYLRVGAPLGCGENYRKRLLRKAARECRNVDDIRILIERTRVFTGTISSLQNAPELLQLKSFSLAIIDEASQVIEPNLIGLFCAEQNGAPAIERFVLIGDQRQLPAVVLQSADSSKVNLPELRSIGLLDCRESLFERLYRLYGHNASIVYQLSHQGRMHPDVADFPNRMFYGNQLLPVPLPHQMRALQLHDNPASRLHSLLLNHRTLFFHLPAPVDTSRTRSGKSNSAEAEAIARIICAYVDIYQQRSKPLSLAEQIGVIVPYRNQISQIRSALRSAAPDSISEEALDTITIDTVERYQGSERDVIIYGLTVQHPYQLQFLTESRTTIDNQEVDRKLNVALTRAREQMIIVGNATLLRQDAIYNRLISDYDAREEVIPWREGME